MVVVLDKIDIEDLKKYKDIIKSMPFSEKACGFISGVKEISSWSKSDLFQLIYDTKALFGNLADIIPLITIQDARQAVKIGAENLYHKACHSFLYDNNLEHSLKCLYKMTFFIIQAEYFSNTNKYISTKKDMIKNLKIVFYRILRILAAIFDKFVPIVPSSLTFIISPRIPFSIPLTLSSLPLFLPET